VHTDYGNRRQPYNGRCLLRLRENVDETEDEEREGLYEAGNTDEHNPGNRRNRGADERYDSEHLSTKTANWRSFS